MEREGAPTYMRLARKRWRNGNGKNARWLASYRDGPLSNWRKIFAKIHFACSATQSAFSRMSEKFLLCANQITENI